MGKRRSKLKPLSANTNQDGVSDLFEASQVLPGNFGAAESARPMSSLVDQDEADENLLWRYGTGAIIIAAVALRFLALTLKPFHHDEGVNGFFLTSLFREGIYKYDPTNYHGPSLYYFALVSSWIFGLDDLAVRVVVAVFGTLTVALVFCFRRYLGTVGTLAAAAFVAVSPGLTYFSRYFIHEILLVFFTLATAICILKFVENEPVKTIGKAAMGLLVFVCLLPVGLQAAASISAGGDQTSLFVSRFVFVLLSVGAAILSVQRISRWDEGRPIYLFLAAAAAAMTFATKETSFISLGTMMIAAGCVAAWVRITQQNSVGERNRRAGFLLIGLGLAGIVVYFVKDIPTGISWIIDTFLLVPDKSEQTLVFAGIATLFIATLEIGRRYVVRGWTNPDTDLESIEKPKDASSGLIGQLRKSVNPLGLIFLTLLVFVAVNVVFFSSFLSNEKGISDAFEAYKVWTKTGSTDHAQNGTWAYLKWTVGLEFPILALAFLGAIIAFWKAKHRVAMFAALWAFGLFAAYTIIPYKTPWIGINFLLPMALAAGYAINELAAGKEWWEHLGAKFLAGLGLSICLFQCIELNYFEYDGERRAYVYVHSKRDMNEMIAKIGEVSTKAKIGDKASIVVASPENWPLPWSLNQYKGAVFYGSVVKIPQAEFVIGSKTQRTELDREYSQTHVVIGNYVLRPGVDLLLYVRRDLAEL